QVDASAADRVGVPTRRLPEHHLRWIDPGHGSAARCGACDVHAGSEADLEHAIAWPDVELRHHPLAPLAVLDRHQHADDGAKPAGRVFKLRTYAAHCRSSSRGLNRFNTAVAASISAAGTPTSSDASRAHSPRALSPTP